MADRSDKSQAGTSRPQTKPEPPGSGRNGRPSASKGKDEGASRKTKGAGPALAERSKDAR
jgi:hypothetical protein